MPALDYSEAARVLESAFQGVDGQSVDVPFIDAPALLASLELVFASKTGSYREALLGVVLATIVAPDADVTKPYVSQGADAFNGRTLDERVVNPFLGSVRIPRTSGPYLNVFRRQVQFTAATTDKVRDKKGFAAMLAIVDAVQGADSIFRMQLLNECLRRFAVLRDAATVAVERVERLSFDQWRALVEQLLATQSGGLLPVVLVQAGLESLGLLTGGTWRVMTQGINEADAARGAGGDITTRAGQQVLDVLEITERPIGAERVSSTFQNKMMPNGLRDYQFIAPTATVSPQAKLEAERYLAQGHEVEFADTFGWLSSLLVVLGPRGRRLFMNRLVELLGPVPTRIRIAWNLALAAVLGPIPSNTTEV